MQRTHFSKSTLAFNFSRLEHCFFHWFNPNCKRKKETQLEGNQEHKCPRTKQEKPTLPAPFTTLGSPWLVVGRRHLPNRAQKQCPQQSGHSTSLPDFKKHLDNALHWDMVFNGSKKGGILIIYFLSTMLIFWLTVFLAFHFLVVPS